ncbi:transmembrane protein 187 [Candoia aspera]|uniref:transmembrane protein 187 n=1 Tax=Candoia aspera TaxID=51853 RepID=UPI002FD83A6C
MENKALAVAAVVWQENRRARLRTLKKTAMKSEDKPFLHVTGGLLLCLLAVASGMFECVHTDIGYEHYAEPTVAGMPAFLAMPANCLINLAYILLGWYWWPPGEKNRQTCYFQEVFALMALAYGPTQWVRLWTQHHWAAVLDQWLTLPIFAWVIVWCLFLEYGWKPYVFLVTEAASLTSYVLALLHPQGFELALGGHIFVVFWRVLKVQRHLGNARSTWIIVLGMISCLGFISLKVWDRELAQWALFSQLTGHFWSKICDVLQFHCAFLFLTLLSGHRLSSQ